MLSPDSVRNSLLFATIIIPRNVIKRVRYQPEEIKKWRRDGALCGRLFSAEIKRLYSEETVRRPIVFVGFMLLVATLACSLVSEDTIFDEERLVTDERPGLVVLAPVTGNVYATGTTVTFHAIAQDSVGVSRIEFEIDVPGEPVVLVKTADSPTPALEAILTWEAGESRTVLILARAFREAGAPGDPLDDIPSNEVVLTIDVVPAPDLVLPTIPQQSDTDPTPDAALDTPSDELPGFPVTISSTQVVPVRQGPGTSYPIVQEVETGATVEIVGRSADAVWLVIRLESGFGWIFRDTVILTDDVSILPVVEAPPQ